METTDKQAFYELHKKYSHGVYREKLLEIGWNHSLIVAEIALQIARDIEKKYKIKTDKDLIEIGALVHDVGFYGCFDDNYRKIEEYIKHGYLGYLILIKENFAENIARFAKVHIGVGVSKEQVEKEKIPMPMMDYIPISLEEEIVTYADGFHSKGRPRFNNYDSQKKELMEMNEDYVIILDRFRRKFGELDLSKIEKKYQKWHKEINQWVDQIRNENR